MRLPRRLPDHRTLLRILRRVVVATAAFALAFAFTQWWDFTVPALGRGEYQAVFLANGQTYFGRFYDRLGAYAKIEDVHYLQQIQGDDPDKPPDTRLLRRGGELHGPESRMLVPKSSILFVEDLQDNSPMAGFIRGSRR
jgi:hypothetical protein